MTRCKTIILSDTPSERDEFGIYLPVVDAFVDMITNDVGGKAIGLSGSWGSGKSTVMRMLALRLAEDPICVWHFDAWAHEGDPLRRTFLERLIDRLNERGWVDKEHWTRKRGELAKRVKTTHSKSTPILTKVGGLAATLALMVPIGIAMVGEGLRESGPFHFSSNFNFLLAAGLIVALGPLIALTVAFVYKGVKRGKLQKDSPLTVELGSLLLKERSTTTETTSAETPEPTSVEFDELFRQLLGDAFAAHQNRRLVLIVDNLDRVDRESALKVWTALQTFLQRDTHWNEQWRNQVWVLVPHAPEAISRLQSIQAAPSESQGAGSRDDGSAFLEKSLQVRIDLPRPVLSDWRDYFLARLKEAFPEHPEGEFEPTFRVYREKRGGTKAPTPREIKTFINELGGLHRVRLDEFPMAHLAYYILLRRQSADIEGLLLTQSVPRPEEITLVSEDIPKHVAALMFGTDVDRALQLLLTDRLTKALTSGDAKSLGDLSTAPGFWPALDAILTNQIPLWQRSAPSSLAFAALALSEGQVLQNAPPANRRLAIDGIQSAVRRTNSWSIDPNVATGLVAALRLQPSEELASRLHESFLEVYGSQRFDTQDATIVTRFAKAAFNLLDGLDSLGFQAVADKGITLGSEAESFIRFAGAWSTAAPDSRFWSRMSSTDPGAIRLGIAARVNGGGFTQEAMNATRVFASKYQEPEWVLFASSYANRMGPSNSLQVDEAFALTTAAIELRHDPRVTESLRTVVEQGFLGHHFASAQQDSPQLATSIVATMLVRHDMLPSGRVGNTETWVQLAMEGGRSAPERLAIEIARLVNEYNLWGEVWSALATKGAFTPLLLRVIGLQIQHSTAQTRFPPASIFDSWDILRDQPWMPSLFQSEEWLGAIEQFLISKAFESRKSDFYAYALRSLPRSADLRNLIDNGLSQLSASEWEEQIKTHGMALQLAVGSSTPPFELGANYRDATNKISSDLIQGSIQLPPEITGGVLLTPLPDHAKSVAEGEIGDMLRASEGKASEAFFVAFREQLASILRRDRESVRRIMSPWISANNLAGLEWLADLIQSEKTFIGDFEPDHWLDLKDRLYTAQETNPELGTVASRISDALQGIQRKKTGRTKQKREIEE